MKRTMLALIVMITIAGLSANAQVFVETHKPLVNQYLDDMSAERSTDWWDHLGQELSFQIEIAEGEQLEATLQNMLYFIYFHGSDIELAAATPRLIEIYRTSDNEALRTMAAAAVFTMGDRQGMKELRKLSSPDLDGRANKVALAAVTEYFQ